MPDKTYHVGVTSVVDQTTEYSMLSVHRATVNSGKGVRCFTKGYLAGVGSVFTGFSCKHTSFITDFENILLSKYLGSKYVQSHHKRLPTYTVLRRFMACVV
jgi:hypothetical protein